MVVGLKVTRGIGALASVVGLDFPIVGVVADCTRAFSGFGPAKS